MEDFDPLGDLDSLFENEDSFTGQSSLYQLLLIGGKNTYKRLQKILEQSIDNYSLIHVESLDEAVVLLLKEIFAIVIIDQDQEDLDAVTVSRVVRINHPLARIVVVSKKRGSQLIANIINLGSVDAFLAHPLVTEYVLKIFDEQAAKHEIAKMLTTFVSQPPTLSKASYLLLDPSLSFADESKPVKFVGIMIIYKSVPRYTKFFEELLAKDEILFAGYLSGVAMLGRELLEGNDPLKEINFGGVSVIFKFIDDIQISIFVRNLTRLNYESAEEVITDTVNQLLNDNKDAIAAFDMIDEQSYQNISDIVEEMQKINQHLPDDIIKPEKVVKDQLVLLYGCDQENQEKVAKYISSKQQCQLACINTNDKAMRFLAENQCKVILLDSKLENDEDPLIFAEHAKEYSPFVQVIYRARDRRASSPLINALNSGYINLIIPYKLPMKEICVWLEKGLEKAAELEQQAKSGEGLDQSLDQAVVAKSMIRENFQTYREEELPELHGIFIFKEITPIFQVFWEYQNSTIQFDEEMMAGLVSSLDSVGGEMFTEDQSIGALELGGANILITHHGDFKITFFLRHVDPNTSIIVNKHINEGADKLFKIIQSAEDKLDTDETQTRFDNLCNQIYSDFTDVFHR